jgi:hypothetical protein
MVLRPLLAVCIALSGPHLHAQVDAVAADPAVDRHRWSVGVELLRPAYDLLTNTPEEQYMRLEGVLQYWLRPDIALRASYAVSEEHVEGPDPLYLTDSAVVSRYTISNTRSGRFSAGIVIQKRQEIFVERGKWVAPLLGVMLLVGTEDRSITHEDQAFLLDSTGVPGEPIPGSKVMRSQADRMLYAGLEISPGLSFLAGQHWELELRLPLEVTYWSTLETGSTNSPTVPDWWSKPVNVGVHLPRVYLWYRW